MARYLTLTLSFLIFAQISTAEKTGFLTALEEKLETNLADYAVNLAKWLESLNDKYLGRSELGRLLHYKEIKPKIEEFTGRQGRSMKKMGMAMLPLVFHVGATSTWMVLTTIMAAKSVAIGLILLVFKIAVSSAKVASFFTTLKNKHSDHHHGWSWAPHYEHHGHERSLSSFEPHPPSLDIHSHSPEPHPPSIDLHSYSPEWSPNDHPPEYHTIPAVYKDYSEHSSLPEISYAGSNKGDMH